MGDIEELKELVAKQSRKSVAAQKKVDDLIAELARERLAGPVNPVHPPVVLKGVSRVQSLGSRTLTLLGYEQDDHMFEAWTCTREI